MPFKVHYEIYDSQHKAPDFETCDFTMARVEWNARKNNPKGLFWRIEQTVMPIGAMSKQEEYLMLVYRVRQLTIRYRNEGQKEEDKRSLMDHVRRLDKWNKAIAGRISSIPNYKPADEKGHCFYLVVSEWRKAYYERQNYGRKPGYEKPVYSEMTRKIRDYEKKIDNYVKDKIQLI